MELPVIDGSGQSAGKLALNEQAFTKDFNETLVHQVVVAYLAAGRAGTRAQKTRAEVRGGGRKPFKQKGTGRARAGTIRSPLWRGGGKIFAATPQDHSQKVNKNMYRAAMRSIFSELVRQERLLVVNQLSVSEPKTKQVIAQLKAFGVAGNAVLVTAERDSNLELAARNLAGVVVRDVAHLDPVSLVGADKVVVSQAAITRVGEWLT